MQAMSSRNAFLVLWTIVFAAKLVLCVTLPLFGDEAWYWLESQRLAWAYSDLPGLTAWLIRFGVEVAGSTQFGVRWPFLALAMAVPWVLRAAAREVAPGREYEVGILALLMPLLGALGLLALPDVPLTFAAALALLAVLRLHRHVTGASAALLALALAIGATSHYRFALLALAGASGLLLDARGRALLRDRRVWLAAAFGVLAWIPLLAWNVAHGAAGVEFQLSERHPWQLHGEGFWLPLSQIFVVSPVLLAALLAAGLQSWRRWRAGIEGARTWLCASAALPIFVYLALAFFADRERVSFHWLLQAWMPLLLLAPDAMSSWRGAWRSLAHALAAAGLVAILAYAAVAATPSLRSGLADSRWYPDNFAGWREIARELDDRSGDDLVADNFMLGAQLAFATRRSDLRMLDHPLNHKHGRSAQLRSWGLQSDPRGGEDARWLIVEDSATPLRLRLARYRWMCGRFGALSTPRSIEVDHGRKRFLVFDRGSFRAGTCILPAIAWIDTPRAGGEVRGRFEVNGWAFKDGAGIASVEVLVDGQFVAQARYGMALPHVARFWRISEDDAHPNVGFAATVDADGLPPGTHWLGLRLHGKDGSVEIWPEQRIEVPR